MEATEANAVAVAPVALVCFEVAGRGYAIDVSHMREVVRWQPTTPLPSSTETTTDSARSRSALECRKDRRIGMARW